MYFSMAWTCYRSFLCTFTSAAADLDSCLFEDSGNNARRAVFLEAQFRMPVKIAADFRQSPGKGGRFGGRVFHEPSPSKFP
jgi:hypothetical protein